MPSDRTSWAPLPRLILDEGHDWQWADGKLRYHYSGGDRCWIILQYGDTPLPTTYPCPWCSEPVTEGANFCGFCGSRMPGV